MAGPVIFFKSQESDRKKDFAVIDKVLISNTARGQKRTKILLTALKLRTKKIMDQEQEVEINRESPTNSVHDSVLEEEVIM